MSHNVEDISCDLDPKVKVKGRILYFLVNASPPEPFEIVSSNIVGPAPIIYFL